MRELLQDFESLLLAERSLFLFFLLHVAGLHGLAGAKSAWMKVPFALCLLASVGFWINSLRLPPSTLGFNKATFAVAASFLSLGGLWLMIAGRASKEWAIGFALVVVAAATLVYLLGHRWPAAACAAMILPLIGTLIWFGEWSDPSESETAPIAERLLSTAAALALAAALGLALSGSKPSELSSIEARPRLRDLVSNPATMLLFVVGGGFSTIVAVRLWPKAEPA